LNLLWDVARALEDGAQYELRVVPVEVVSRSFVITTHEDLTLDSLESFKGVPGGFTL
jgi:hypothetical protein